MPAKGEYFFPEERTALVWAWSPCFLSRDGKPQGKADGSANAQSHGDPFERIDN